MAGHRLDTQKIVRRGQRAETAHTGDTMPRTRSDVAQRNVKRQGQIASGIGGGHFEFWRQIIGLSNGLQ